MGIDTPETVHTQKEEQPYGQEASNYTKTRLENGDKIELEYDSNSSSGNPYIGGIVGKSFAGNIFNCYNNGNIKQNNFSVGGITGGADNTIVKNCYNSGEIISNKEASGGIVGSGYNTIIKECYHKGNISGKSEQKPNAFEGGIAGGSYSADNIELCKWHSDTIEYAVGSLGITDGYTINLEMPDIISIINDENTFKEDKNNINNGYPILNWE